MSVLSVSFLLVQAALGGATLSGQVVDQQGSPLAQARVFIEPGIGGTLQEVQTDAAGHFAFTEVNPGAVGLFAIAQGYGFNGQHVNVLIEDQIPSITIQLNKAGSLSGKVENHRDKSVEGARITRAVLLNEQKVAIPLGKLNSHGFPLVTTDSKGRFVLDSFAVGDSIALKVVHKDYAQTGTAPLSVGSNSASIKLYPGIISQGTVTGAPGGGGTVVLIQNAQPPHNTALVTPDARGAFALRLNPGTYLCRAQAGISRSPGWKQWIIPAENSPAPMTLNLSGAGIITGSIKNAVSGEAIPGVSVSLRSSGNLAGRTKTGSSGLFRFEAGVGSNTVMVEPLSGYFPPRMPRLTLELSDGETYTLPGMWMKPIPDYALVVCSDDAGTPVQNVSVRLLQPQQWGAYSTDAAGKTLLRISQAPEDNTLIGLAEDTQKPFGALFAISAHSLEAEHTVQLYEYATVKGALLTKDLKPASGVTVAALTQLGEVAEPVAVWRAVTQPDGTFTWHTAFPDIPFTIVAFEGTEAKAFSGSFQLKAGEVKELPPIQSDALRPGNAEIGKRLDWYKMPLLSGELPERHQRDASCWLVVYTSAESLIPLAESLLAYQDKIVGLKTALILNAQGNESNASIPVLKGEAPGMGNSYLVDREGKVIWETFGLPALHDLRVRIQ